MNYCITITHGKSKPEITTDWIEVASVDISNAQDKEIIGYISIPEFGNNFYIDMPIKDGTELNILATAIGHFKGTPYENGNICLAGHNGRNKQQWRLCGIF